ncbi:MAG TPA: response regulator [Kiloniellales bacterium]|jgi:CheY-like chemotaxis protein
MRKLHWDRLCVLVVDDNSFMRNLLTTTIKGFGISDTIADADGASAIERLKLSMTDPIAASLGTVDLIISDFVMPGVDGNLFLRWIRTGNGVPDRFVPFIMVSGAADKNVVEQARDAGVTEFLAKPFSAQSMADRILHVINNPRQFVLAQGYFGPDRRRAEGACEVERRVTQRSEIQVVKPDSTARTLREDVRAIYFRPNNQIRQKIGAKAFTEALYFDPLIVQAAERRIQALVGDYADWVKRYIKSMTDSESALKTDRESRQSNKKHIANINRIAHELRGQSGTFNYPLITKLSKSLYETTLEPDRPVTDDRKKLIDAHIDAIRTVFKNRITGNGGEIGLALLHDIEVAVKKYK